MIMRALPERWQVEITQAENGLEALAAYRAGKAEVMFLDLTMPVMDGFAVLEQLQKETLNSFVFVVSADIQPEAQERAKQLGAAAFIRKPINPGSIEDALQKFGIL